MLSLIEVLALHQLLVLGASDGFETQFIGFEAVEARIVSGELAFSFVVSWFAFRFVLREIIFTFVSDEFIITFVLGDLRFRFVLDKLAGLETLLKALFDTPPATGDALGVDELVGTE